MNLNPYISFQGTAREALEFYQSVLGGELAVDDFTAFPDMGIPEDETHFVMHGQLTTPEGMILMASDTPSIMEYTAPTGISVSISGDDPDRLQAVWDGLSAGGRVNQPYVEPPWGGKFGMLTDRFGIDWMVALNAVS